MILVEDSMATVRSIIQSWFYRGRIAYYSALKSPINELRANKNRYRLEELSKNRR
jgi:hypothetical protein